MSKWDYWKNEDRQYYKEVFKKRALMEVPVMESQKACMEIVDNRLTLENPNILDVGCGSGYFINSISELFKIFNYTGLDLNDTYLKIGKEIFGNKKNITFLHGDAQNLPFHPNLFDLIISVNTFPHIPNIKKALEDCIRVSKKYILIRLLISDELTIVKKSLDMNLDSEGEPTNYMLVNTYTKSYIKHIVGNRAEITFLDDIFDERILKEHHKSHENVAGKHIATNIDNKKQRKGIIELNWKFLLLEI